MQAMERSEGDLAHEKEKTDSTAVRRLVQVACPAPQVEKVSRAERHSPRRWERPRRPGRPCIGAHPRGPVLERESFRFEPMDPRGSCRSSEDDASRFLTTPGCCLGEYGSEAPPHHLVSASLVTRSAAAGRSQLVGGWTPTPRAGRRLDNHLTCLRRTAMRASPPANSADGMSPSTIPAATRRRGNASATFRACRLCGRRKTKTVLPSRRPSPSSAMMPP